MIKATLSTLLALSFIAIGAALAFWLGPEMLISGHPALVLLAWLLPPAWLIAGLAIFIIWADSGWREDWHSTVEPELDTNTQRRTPHFFQASAEART